MLVEQCVDCPFPNEFPLHLLIRIWPYGRKYQVCIQTEYVEEDDCPKDPYMILLNDHEVDALNTELQARIRRLSSNVMENGAHRAEYGQALSNLAETGQAAFNRIFTEGKLRNTIHGKLQMGATIQMVSEEFFLPWELLYDGPLDDAVEPSCFWGMQYIILRTLTAGVGSGDFASSTLPSCPRVGLVAYGRLKHVATREIPALKKLEQGGKILFSRLSPLTPAKHQAGLAEFDRFLRSEVDILHLACHAIAGKLRSDTLIRVSNSFDITMENFDARGYKIQHNPVVLFNACLSGMISPLYSASWAMLFCQCGARGILATEFRVPDWFAASFIEEFYNQLLLGKTIGEALLASRRHFLNSHLLGLGYALYATRPSIKIVS